MTKPDDPFTTFDAAYVLGALSPEERGAFEHHLRECPECARAVQEVAGLPGLLSQVSPDMIEPEPAPANILPSVLTRVRRSRRRRTLVTAAISAASVAAAVAVVVAVLSLSGQQHGTAMTPLGPYPVQAVAAVQAESGGAHVNLSCSYHGTDSGADYRLVVVRADGSETELATWWADPDATAEMSIDTAISPTEILALEVRTMTGQAVLRWQP